MCKSNMSDIDQINLCEFHSLEGNIRGKANNFNLNRLKEYQSIRNQKDNVYYVIDFSYEGDHVYSVIPRFLLKDLPPSKPRIHDTIGGCRHSSVVAIIDPQWLKSNESKLPQILLECQRLENELDTGIAIFQENNLGANLISHY